MPTKTLRLEHAELCRDCADLLPIGTTVVVDDECRVTCLSCTPLEAPLRSSAMRFDPWSAVDDARLRDQLQHRHVVEHHLPVLVSA